MYTRVIYHTINNKNTTNTHKLLHLHMDAIHEDIVEELPVLIELLQAADGAAILRHEAQVYHPGSRLLLGKVVGQVGVVHRVIFVGDIVAVRIAEVERRRVAAI